LTLCDEALQKLQNYDANKGYNNLADVFRQITSPLIDGNKLTSEIRGAVPAKDLSSPSYSAHGRDSLAGVA
jgi:hypothetical protein